MMAQYNKAIGKILWPQEVTYKLCLDILQETDVGMTIEEMCRIAIHKDNQVLNYLGYIWQMEHNKKLRDVVDSLENNPNIKRVNSRPIVLKWLTDPSDPTDLKTEKKSSEKSENSNKFEENNSETGSDRSDRSDRSQGQDNEGEAIK